VKRNVLLYLTIFATGFSLAQLTRSVSYELAIGFAVTAFWEAIGAGLTLFAMGLGLLTLYRHLMTGVEQLYNQIEKGAAR
jgi:hypothetical protein